MGSEWIENAIAELERSQIRVQRGYPAEKMPYLTEPVAVIYVQKAYLKAMTLAVRVYSPMNLGGAACEDKAVEVLQAMARIGGVCSAQPCGFDARAGLFYMTVLAHFAEVVEVV